MAKHYSICPIVLAGFALAIAAVVSAVPPIPQNGLRLWLRSDTGVIVDPSGRLTSWKDQSSNANDAFPPSSTARPSRIGSTDFFGLPGIQFDGVDDCLSCSTSLGIQGNSNSTIFLLFRLPASPLSNRGIFSLIGGRADWESPGGLSISQTLTVLQGFNSNNSNPGNPDFLSLGASPALESASLVCVHKENGVAFLRINGAQAATDTYSWVTPSTDQGYTMSCRSDPGSFVHFGQNTFAEVIAYNRALSGPEIAAVETYLSAARLAIPPRPYITSTLTATATVNTPFSYQIIATNNPESFTAVNLPTGLTLDSNTGLISGLPAAAGVFSISISATAAGMAGTATLTLTIVPQQVPTITSEQVVMVSAGSPLNYSITATDGPASFNATSLPTGLVVNTSTGLIQGTLLSPGTSAINLAATNGIGTGTATLTLIVGQPQQYVYDNSGRLISASQAGGLNTTYGYDAASNLTYVYSIFAGPDENSNGVPDSWELHYFGDLNSVGANTRKSANGMPDFLNYAFGVTPTSQSMAQQPSFSIGNVSGQRYFYMTFRRLKGSSSMTYLPQASVDLKTWLSGSEYFESAGAAVDNEDGTETIAVRCTLDLAAHPKLFLRLLIESP